MKFVQVKSIEEINNSNLCLKKAGDFLFCLKISNFQKLHIK